MNIVYGDILDCEDNIIVQQVNHRGVMGAGLALQIRKKYPEIFRGYKSICQTIDFETIKRDGYVYYYVVSPTQRIASVFGQKSFGMDGRQYTDYKSLSHGLSSVGKIARKFNLSIAIPYMIGCGLGGGDWSVVKGIIGNQLKHCDVKVYRLL